MRGIYEPSRKNSFLPMSVLLVIFGLGVLGVGSGDEEDGAVRTLLQRVLVRRIGIAVRISQALQWTVTNF